MESLEFIRLANSRLTEYPAVLQAPKMTWVGLAGNPITARSDEGSDRVPTITRDMLRDEVPLGGETSGGASGDLKSGVYQGKKVVIKYFKEEVSPDGTAADEVAVASAMDHPSATGAIAVLREPLAYVMQPTLGTR